MKEWYLEWYYGVNNVVGYVIVKVSWKLVYIKDMLWGCYYNIFFCVSNIFRVRINVEACVLYV